MQLANVAAQHAWIRARTARMTRADAAVTTHHHPRLRVERFDVGLFHRMTNNARSAVVHDLHVELDRTDLLPFTDVIHGAELVIGMCATTDDRDVCWSTNVGESARDVDRIFVAPTRN